MSAELQQVLPIDLTIYDGEPFIKWAGGKTQLLSQLTKYFPKKFTAYIEPFMGGAAVFFYLRRTRGNFPAYLFDWNPELVNCFQQVRDRVDALIPFLRRHQLLHDEKHYYEVRAELPSTLTELQRAARFIYLNKTCYNGLYRVNARGQFNVPMGSHKNPHIFDETDLRATGAALQGVTIEHRDFSDVYDVAQKGDFVYIDPPYHTEGKGFTGYAVGVSGRTEFGASEQRRLSNTLDKLRERGCYVMESNSHTKFIQHLYYDYKVHTVQARRAINSNGNGRGMVKEIVITNYDKDSK